MKIKVDSADRIFSMYIRKRDGECRRCHSKVRFNAKGDPVSHQASHFQGRRKEATRFDEENVTTLCTGCHMYFHENPLKHFDFQVGLLGQEKVNELILKSRMYQKKDRKMAEIYWKKRYAEL